MNLNDNPAKRLHEILSDALKKGQGKNILLTWALTFGIEEKDKALIGKVFNYLGLLHQLTYDIEEGIRRIPNINADLYLRVIPDIRLALSPVNTKNPFQETARYLNAGTMVALEFISNELAKYHHEDIIPKEDLDNIRVETSELFDQIKAATIDEDLKALLLDLLAMIMRAIDEYRIRGAAGLRNIVAFSIGQFVMHHDLCKKSQNEPVVKKFNALLDKVLILAATATKLCQLYGKVAKYLGLPPVGDDQGN